ncbi:MAG: RagB/SusD family nutrient uptake outer membrane protein [Bacteroidales bacterium]
MLNYKNIFLATTMTALLSSCGSDFLNLDPHQQIGDDVVIQKVEDISTVLSGVYNRMGSAGFIGRNLTAIGDVATDNVYNANATNHLSAIFDYTYQPTSSDLTSVWNAGYKVIDHSARIIHSAPKLLASVTSKSDSAKIYSGLSQAYALRGYATFALTNLFALPYSADNLQEPGVVLVEEPIAVFQKIKRASLEETYAYITEQFEFATNYAKVGSAIANSQFYMNPRAIAAMKARVALYKGNYADAKVFAKEAIGKIEEENRIATTETAYNEMFDKVSGTPEDIFVIAKSSDDHLSANSLNTLYNNYGLGISDDLAALYDSTDVRFSKMTTYDKNGYYTGGKYAADVANVSVIRLPEMYLIVAECEAEQGNAVAATAALYEVAKRNLAITSVAKLPTELDAIKAFIVDERRRETIKVAGGAKELTDGQILYPIPADEINTGLGVTQNDNWTSYLPK